MVLLSKQQDIESTSSGLKGIPQTRKKLIHRIASPLKGVLLTPFKDSQILDIKVSFVQFNDPAYNLSIGAGLSGFRVVDY